LIDQGILEKEINHALMIPIARCNKVSLLVKFRQRVPQRIIVVVREVIVERTAEMSHEGVEDFCSQTPVFLLCA
jgi:hypothetical protein